jgi:hypothetical protein
VLVVKVELWPFGDAASSREIGRIGIANISGSDVSDYIAVLVDDAGRCAHMMIADHARKDGFWPLVAQAARNATPPEVLSPIPEDLHAVVERVAHRMTDPGT